MRRHYLYAMNGDDPDPNRRGDTRSWFYYYKWPSSCDPRGLGEVWVPKSAGDELVGVQPGDVLWFSMDRCVLGGAVVTQVYTDAYNQRQEVWYNADLVFQWPAGLRKKLSANWPKNFPFNRRQGERWLQTINKVLVEVNMAEKLPDSITKITTAEAFNALAGAWMDYFNNPPKYESVALLTAQWALETGWGKSMHNNNFGNIKSSASDGLDYCYFACGEEVPYATAVKLQTKSPDLIDIRRVYGEGARQKASIWVKPEHSWCRFRAYKTLREGACDYLSLLFRRFNNAWPAVRKGDPAQFSHLIRQQGYYTADEAQYTKTLIGVYSKVVKQVPSLDIDNLNVLTEDEQKRAMNIVALTTDQLIRAKLEAIRKGGPDSD